MRKPCMLLVDNDPDFLDSEAAAMTRRGYCVLKAASADEAKDLAEHHNVDLALVDMRLQFDTEEHDTSGIKLCRELGHTIVRVLQTAYAIPPSEITLWRRQRILTAIFSKDQPAARRREAIAGVIQKDVRTHFDLDVSFNDGPENPEDWSALASAMKAATEPVIGDDVSLVFHRLFPKSVKSVNIFPVRQGAGGAGVVIADVEHAETKLRETLIVKYGLNRGLKNERKNVEKYVMPLGPQGVAPMRWSALSRNLSAIAYWMVQTAPGIRALSLAEHVREENPSPDVVKAVFTDVCRPWYQASRRPVKPASSLRAYYMKQRWPGSTDAERKTKLLTKTEPLLRSGRISRSEDGSDCCATIAGCEVRVPDPVQVAACPDHDDQWPQIAEEYITHGDLHGRNIFVVGDHPCLIDFTECGWGHVFRDLATLEVSLRYDSLHDFGDPGAVWKLEEQLAKRPLQAPNLRLVPLRLRRAVEFTKTIREQAPVMAGHVANPEQQYAAALFFALLKRAGIPEAAAVPAAGADPTLPQQIAYLAAGRIAEHWLIRER